MENGFVQVEAGTTPRKDERAKLPHVPSRKHFVGSLGVSHSISLGTVTLIGTLKIYLLV